MSKSDSALIIFVKNPELGKVKTRLAQTLGNKKAFDIYLKLIAKTRSVASEIKCDKFVFYSSFVDDSDHWSKESFNKKLQYQSPDLGVRMSSAFRELSKSYAKLVIIGSDCPQISKEVLNNAFTKLDATDLVIGPALDGGYYLLGINDYYPALFEHIEWSSNQVFRQTIYNTLVAGLDYEVLETLSDIDYQSDWEKYGW